MNILIENKITEARKFFEDDSYLLDFYNSAIECYEKSDSPLKINNFACNIRELLREKMALVAPDNIVAACSWCKGQKYLDTENKPTRRARIRYCLLSNMPDSTVEEIFKEKIEEIENEYTSQIKQLSVYTHVTKEVFYKTQNECDLRFSEILNLLSNIIGLIKTAQKMTTTEIENFLYDDISDHIYNDYIDPELDLLSNHTYVEGISDLNYSIDNIDKDYIFIEGTATLDTCLQYGSYSEMHRGDGASFDMSFDMDFSVKINITDFDDKEYKYETVNTDKFYGIEDGE